MAHHRGRFNGLDLLSEQERSLWTPSIGGGVIHLEVRAPAGPEVAEATGSFVLAEVAEVFRLAAAGGGRSSALARRRATTFPAWSLPPVGVRAFAADHRPRRAILVCNERAPRLVEGIDILPRREFLARLWAGRVLS